MSAVPDSKVTTMESLRRPAGMAEDRMPVVKMGWGDLQGFELMQRGAKAIASSTLVPQQFQGNIPNCLIALEMAQRIGASPLMVCQNLYIVHGRPGWSAKFLIASFNQCGRFSALRFEWTGTRGKDDWGCRAWATERATGERIEGPLITIALAKAEGWESKTGSKWKTIPELMLTYRAAAWLVNTHAPEISMGLNSAEEIGDVYDAEQTGDGRFSVTLDDLGAPPVPPAADATDAVPVPPAAAQVTVVDAIAELAKATSEETMALYADTLPDEIKQDERFMKAYRARSKELRQP